MSPACDEESRGPLFPTRGARSSGSSPATQGALPSDRRAAGLDALTRSSAPSFPS
jgi:hypothetical protein